VPDSVGSPLFWVGFTLFVLNNLAPGRYAVVVLEAQSGKIAYRLALVLAEQQQAWKLAGFWHIRSVYP